MDDQEINYFFGRNGVKNIQACANNAQRILREIFCDWVTSIEISEKEPSHYFGENAFLINFKYTPTLLKRFGVKEMNELIKPFLENPYYHIARDAQMRLETAAVRRRYWREQKERNNKIQKEYLRMLNKQMHLGYLTPVEAFLEADEEMIKKLNGTEWHISYFSDKDKKRIETVMSGFGCKNYTLHNSIDECIKEFKIG